MSAAWGAVDDLLPFSAPVDIATLIRMTRYISSKVVDRLIQAVRHGCKSAPQASSQQQINAFAWRWLPAWTPQNKPVPGCCIGAWCFREGCCTGATAARRCVRARAGGGGRAQVQKVRLLLRERGLGAVRVGTVDDYQGQEERIILISTVRAPVPACPPALCVFSKRSCVCMRACPLTRKACHTGERQ